MAIEEHNSVPCMDTQMRPATSLDVQRCSSKAYRGNSYSEKGGWRREASTSLCVPRKLAILQTPSETRACWLERPTWDNNTFNEEVSQKPSEAKVSMSERKVLFLSYNDVQNVFSTSVTDVKSSPAGEILIFGAGR